MSAFEKLQEIISTTLEVPSQAISENTSMDDIKEWDSLGQVHIMVALEQAFDLYMDVEDFAEMTSVPAILAYLATENIG